MKTYINQDTGDRLVVDSDGYIALEIVKKDLAAIGARWITRKKHNMATARLFGSAGQLSRFEAIKRLRAMVQRGAHPYELMQVAARIVKRRKAPEEIDAIVAELVDEDQYNHIVGDALRDPYYLVLEMNKAALAKSIDSIFLGEDKDDPAKVEDNVIILDTRVLCGKVPDATMEQKGALIKKAVLTRVSVLQFSQEGIITCTRWEGKDGMTELGFGFGDADAICKARKKHPGKWVEEVVKPVEEDLPVPEPLPEEKPEQLRLDEDPRFRTIQSKVIHAKQQ